MMEASISQEIVDRYVATLPEGHHRDLFRSNVSALEELARTANDLGEFLPSFARRVADLYAATGVAIWFQAPNGHSVQRKVDVGWNNVPIDDVTRPAHDLLLEFVMKGKQPQAVHPFAAPASGAGVSNPTDSFLLLTPIQFGEQQVAVLEIALGPKPLRPSNAILVAAYLEWLTWLGRLMQDGVERSFAQVDNVMLLAMETIEKTESGIQALQEQIRTQIEASLCRLAGQNFGSLSSNQAVAKRIHAMLDARGLRVVCPQCGSPAILRCQKAGNSTTGAFMFDHYLEGGRTFHGGQSTFPQIRVVPKPPRRGSGK